MEGLIGKKSLSFPIEPGPHRVHMTYENVAVPLLNGLISPSLIIPLKSWFRMEPLHPPISRMKVIRNP